MNFRWRHPARHINVFRRHPRARRDGPWPQKIFQESERERQNDFNDALADPRDRDSPIMGIGQEARGEFPADEMQGSRLCALLEF